MLISNSLVQWVLPNKSLTEEDLSRNRPTGNRTPAAGKIQQPAVDPNSNSKDS